VEKSISLFFIGSNAIPQSEWVVKKRYISAQVSDCARCSHPGGGSLLEESQVAWVSHDKTHVAHM
jgi:hypothetical protein